MKRGGVAIRISYRPPEQPGRARFGGAEVDKIRRELAELRQQTEHPSIDR
ncbi:hypothetical protein [Williamsia sp. 1135]|nr:hypothetical protein [Williamsia sp. 1135]